MAATKSAFQRRYPIWELGERLPTDRPVPLFVFDAGYDPEALARELAELDGQQVAVLVRLRSDRCFYADPPPAVGEKVGRASAIRPSTGPRHACGLRSRRIAGPGW